jgi:hypothetical protein
MGGVSLSRVKCRCLGGLFGNDAIWENERAHGHRAVLGETLMIQQYVGEITEKHHNRMVSISDSFTPNGRIKVQII